MTVTVELNGLHADMDEPPDEHLYRPESGVSIELVRSRHGWEVREYREQDAPSVHVFDAYEPAMSQFQALVAQWESRVIAHG